MPAQAIRILSFVLAAASLLLAPSCLIGSETKRRTRGQYIDVATFNSIQPGATQDEVFERFGEPTTRTKRDDTELWKYYYTEATTKKGGVLFLIATKSETEHEGAVTVEFDKDMRVHRISRR